MPGLLLRALIPIGFMPMFGPGLSVSLMLCPVYAPVPAGFTGVAPHEAHNGAAAESMDMSGAGTSMDMSMGTGKEPSTRVTTPPPTGGGVPSSDYQQHSLCPYAKSATLAGSLASLNLSVAEQPLTRVVLLAPQISWFQISPRAQSPRAPPVLG